MGLMQVILTPFSWLITVFNDLFGNYGAALILFALLVKLILFPFSIKGKRSMIQMNAVSAKVNKLQKMYGNNKEKYNLEVQKLYEKEKVNPMGGCLWSMLPLLILLPLYYIVREPLTYMMSLTADQITALLSALPQTVEQTGPYYQLTAADLLARHFSAVVSSPAVAAFKDSLKALNFNFLGVNLASTPNWKFWVDGISWGSVGLFLMPIISAGTSFLFSFISMKTNAVNQQSAQATNSTTKSMMLMSPLISLWIGFAMPASMSIYWIAQNLFSLIQEFLAGRILKKDYEKAAEDAKRREEEEKEEEKRQREVERAERTKRIEDAKNKKKDAKRESDDKIPAAVKEASRVGIRAYARGRAYDPNRFSTSGSAAVPEAASDEPVTQETEEK